MKLNSGSKIMIYYKKIMMKNVHNFRMNKNKNNNWDIKLINNNQKFNNFKLHQKNLVLMKKQMRIYKIKMNNLKPSIKNQRKNQINKYLMMLMKQINWKKKRMLFRLKLKKFNKNALISKMIQNN